MRQARGARVARMAASASLAVWIGACAGPDPATNAGGADSAGAADAAAAGDSGGDTAESGVPARCADALAEPYWKHEGACDLWGWTFEGDWRDRLPVLEGDEAQCADWEMAQRNLYVAYPDYRGHAGCTVLLGVACLNGWLILNDDPVDPVALRPVESRCEVCSKDAPCTHVLNATPGIVTVMPGCPFHLPCGSWGLNVDEVRAPQATPAAHLVVDGGTVRLATGGMSCACECDGLASCDGPPGPPERVWAPITPFTAHIPEAPPLAVEDPETFTAEVPPVVSGEWAEAACRVAQCQEIRAGR